MSGYYGSHEAFLAVAIGTHALVGYALGAALLRAPRAGLLGGVVADVDLLFPAAWGFPFVHRGVTHTALAAGLAVAVAAVVGRRVAGGVAVGYASQLLVDATTPAGVPIAYPLSAGRVGVDLGGHSPVATLALWFGSLLLLGWQARRSGADAIAT